MNKNKLNLAMKQYTEGKISMGKAAELANVSIWKFLDEMKGKKIPIRYDLDDIKREINRIISR